MGRFKSISKFCGRWSWQLFAIANLIIGLAGVPGDLATWATWIDTIMNDPFVLQLAGYAVAVAEFINHPLVRAALVIAGLLMLFWPVRWFWRLRHRLVFWGKRALDQEVWISRDKAHDLVRESRWARSRRRRAETPRSIFEFNVLQTNPAHDEQNAMFRNWCGLALDEYARVNGNAVRESEKGQEFNESALRSWLDTRFRTDLTAEFGEPR